MFRKVKIRSKEKVIAYMSPQKSLRSMVPCH